MLILRGEYFVGGSGGTFLKITPLGYSILANPQGKQGAFLTPRPLPACRARRGRKTELSRQLFWRISNYSKMCKSRQPTGRMWKVEDVVGWARPSPCPSPSEGSAHSSFVFSWFSASIFGPPVNTDWKGRQMSSAEAWVPSHHMPGCVDPLVKHLLWCLLCWG